MARTVNFKFCFNRQINYLNIISKILFKNSFKEHYYTTHKKAFLNSIKFQFRLKHTKVMFGLDLRKERK